MTKRYRHPWRCRLFGHDFGPWSGEMSDALYRVCLRKGCAGYELA